MKLLKILKNRPNPSVLKQIVVWRIDEEKKEKGKALLGDFLPEYHSQRGKGLGAKQTRALRRTGVTARLSARATGSSCPVWEERRIRPPALSRKIVTSRYTVFLALRTKLPCWKSPQDKGWEWLPASEETRPQLKARMNGPLPDPHRALEAARGLAGPS